MTQRQFLYFTGPDSIINNSDKKQLLMAKDTCRSHLNTKSIFLLLSFEVFFDCL